MFTKELSRLLGLLERLVVAAERQAIQSERLADLLEAAAAQRVKAGQ